MNSEDEAAGVGWMPNFDSLEGDDIDAARQPVSSEPSGRGHASVSRNDLENYGPRLSDVTVPLRQSMVVVDNVDDIFVSPGKQFPAITPERRGGAYSDDQVHGMERRISTLLEEKEAIAGLLSQKLEGAGESAENGNTSDEATSHQIQQLLPQSAKMLRGLRLQLSRTGLSEWSSSGDLSTLANGREKENSTPTRLEKSWNCRFNPVEVIAAETHLLKTTVDRVCARLQERAISSPPKFETPQLSRNQTDPGAIGRSATRGYERSPEEVASQIHAELNEARYWRQKAVNLEAEMKKLHLAAGEDLAQMTAERDSRAQLASRMQSKVRELENELASTHESLEALRAENNSRLKIEVSSSSVQNISHMADTLSKDISVLKQIREGIFYPESDATRNLKTPGPEDRRTVELERLKSVCDQHTPQGGGRVLDGLGSGTPDVKVGAGNAGHTKVDDAIHVLEELFEQNRDEVGMLVSYLTHTESSVTDLVKGSTPNAVQPQPATVVKHDEPVEQRVPTEEKEEVQAMRATMRSLYYDLRTLQEAKTTLEDDAERTAGELRAVIEDKEKEIAELKDHLESSRNAMDTASALAADRKEQELQKLVVELRNQIGQMQQERNEKEKELREVLAAEVGSPPRVKAAKRIVEEGPSQVEDTLPDSLFDEPILSALVCETDRKRLLEWLQHNVSILRRLLSDRLETSSSEVYMEGQLNKAVHEQWHLFSPENWADTEDERARLQEEIKSLTRSKERLVAKGAGLEEQLGALLENFFPA